MEIEVNFDDLSDFIWDCDTKEAYTPEYGMIELVDVDDIRDELIPRIIDHINSKSENFQIILK